MSSMHPQIITGNLADIFQQKVFSAGVSFQHGKILSITPLDEAGAVNNQLPWLIPGLIDAHVHIESSMLIPSEFARLAVVHGTVATVSDPHEIANVCGLQGVDFMIRNGQSVPFKFYFGAPSCVPATVFETAGACLDAEEVSGLLQRAEIRYLSEMMNFPGVLHGDKEVMKKIHAALKLGKPVDGHAPGLMGDAARKYIGAGISTDHECFTRKEALEKLKLGMKIIIREGSAARNFESLIDLLHDFPDAMMFCSDDKHPDSLVAGHINQLCARAVAKGVDVFKVLRAACVNPVLHYGLDVGLLRPGDPADMIVVKDLKNFQVLQTYINGQLVAENGKSKIKSCTSTVINNFQATYKKVSDFETRVKPAKAVVQAPPQSGYLTIPVIEALEGQLITNKLDLKIKSAGGLLQPDIKNDILKIAVVNRYKEAPVSTAFIRNFGLKRGAIASSVAHDSHNVVAVGADDTSLCQAVNLVIEQKGGISCVDGGIELVLPLPVAGLMSSQDGYRIAEAYTAIDAMVKSLGTSLKAPFMTLSFMALLVIPHLKLSDEGLFDGDQFKLIAKGSY